MIDTFLVVGCGSMGRRRVRHLKTLRPNARVVVYDLRQDRMDEMKALLGAAPLEGLPGPELSLAGMFISVPPSEHEFYMNWAVANRVSFMVEQPISHMPHRLADLRKKIKDANLVVHVSNNHRYSARLRALKSIIDGGTLGQPLAGMVAMGEWLPNWHPYEPYQDYYPSSRAMGGGLDAVCDLDWLRYLFGDLTAGVCLASKVSDLEIDTCDVAQFVLRFKKGIQVVLHTDMLDGSYHETMRFIFSSGTVVHHEPETVLKVFRKETGEWDEMKIKEEVQSLASMQGKPHFNFVEPMYERDSAAFLDRLATGDVNLDSLDNGIRNIELIWNLMRKGATQKPFAPGEV